MRVTVLMVWVRGHVPYGAEYVERLARQVRRHSPAPEGDYEIACLTDRPRQLPRGVRPIEVRPTPGVFAWWTKVRMFDPELPLAGDVVLSLDLDLLVVDDLDRVAVFQALHPRSLCAIPHEGDFQGRDGLRVVKLLNSSVMCWRRGDHGHLHRDWTPAVARDLWGDQDWVGQEAAPAVELMPAAWFPRLRSLRGAPPGPDVVAVLCKKPKPHVAASIHPWVAQAWGAPG